jgi:hypothetical protein
MKLLISAGLITSPILTASLKRKKIARPKNLGKPILLQERERSYKDFYAYRCTANLTSALQNLR